MTHIGKVILLKHEQYKRITHIWSRKTIHNNKNDVNNILNSKLNTFYFSRGKQYNINKKSYKVYITYKEGYKKIGYIFWDVFLNKLYNNKYYVQKESINNSLKNIINCLEQKEIYINPDEEDKDYLID